MTNDPDASVRALRHPFAGAARERRIRRSTHEQDGHPHPSARLHRSDADVPIGSVEDVSAVRRAVHERPVQALHARSHPDVLTTHRPAVVVEHAAQAAGVVDVSLVGHGPAVPFRLPGQAGAEPELPDLPGPASPVMPILEFTLRGAPGLRRPRGKRGEGDGCRQEEGDPSDSPASNRDCEHSRASRSGRWWVPTPEPEGPGPSVARPPAPGGGEVRSFASRRSRRFAVSGPHALPFSSASSASGPSSFSPNDLHG